MDEGLSFTEAITPYLPLIGVLLGGLLIGIFGIWNRRRGAIETRAPDVNEIWQRSEQDHKELDIERSTRRHLEDCVYTLHSVFKSYVDRVRRGGSSELNTKELEIYTTNPSSFVKKKDE